MKSILSALILGLMMMGCAGPFRHCAPSKANFSLFTNPVEADSLTCCERLWILKGQADLLEMKSLK